MAASDIVHTAKKPLASEGAPTDVTRYVDSKFGSANHSNLVSTRRTILRLINGSLPLNAVTSAVLESFVQRRMSEGCKAQTIKHGLNCIVAAIRKARKDGYEVAEIDPPVVKVPNRMVRYLSMEEERRLLAELDPRRLVKGLPSLENRRPSIRRQMQDNLDLVVILIDTGARYSEIANILWKQIDLTTRSISLWRPKVQNESVIFMTDRVAAILERRRGVAEGNFVFSNGNGKARGYSAIAIRKAFRRAGLHDCTIHTLRHTHATRLIQNGLNVYEVKTVLGHSDIKTTMRYAHLEQAGVTQRARDVIERLNAS